MIGSGPSAATSRAQVAHRLPHTAEAPRRGRLDDAGQLPQGLQKRPSQVPRLPQGDAPAPALQGLNPCQNFLLRPDAHPREGAQFARPCCFLQFGDGRDAQLLPEKSRLAGSDVGDLEHLHDAFRDLGPQFLVGLQTARPHQFVYFLRQRLADPRNGLQFPRAPDLLQRTAQRGDILRRPSVGHNPVGVVPQDVQNVGHSGKNRRDPFVLHLSYSAKCRSARTTRTVRGR